MIFRCHVDLIARNKMKSFISIVRAGGTKRLYDIMDKDDFLFVFSSEL